MATRARIEVDRSGSTTTVRDRYARYWPRREPEAVAQLRALVAERAQLDGRIAVSVQELRTAGASWSVVGDVLGVSRSAAQKRFGRDELVHG